MELDSDTTTKICREAALGQPLSIDTPEARAFRRKIDAEIEEAEKHGLIMDLPSEIAG